MKKTLLIIHFSIVMLLPVFGQGISVKINDYEIKEYYYNALLFDSLNIDVCRYAEQVAVSPNNPLGDNAIAAFGSIGNDGIYLETLDGNIDLVYSPVEYYFTDLVFIKGEYEKAIIDLFFYRAEYDSKAKETEEAIGGTFWVVEQNGVSLDVDAVYNEYLAQVDAKLDGIEAPMVAKWGAGVIDYLAEVKTAVKAYFANPTTETFMTIVTTIISPQNSPSFEGSYAVLLSDIYDMIARISPSLGSSVGSKTREELAAGHTAEDILRELENCSP